MKNFKINTRKKVIPNALVENLAKLLDSHQITEYDLAKNLNIPYNTINRIMTGLTTDPRLSTLEQIANYFGVKLDFLLHSPKQSSQEMDIPVLNWDLVSKPAFLQDIDHNKWNKWIAVAHLLEDTTSLDKIFAIESTKSMDPRFPIGTTFIIQTNESPIDGDLILVRFKTDNSVSLRELVVDSPNWQLNPIIPGSQTILFNHMDHIIIGIVTLTLRQTRAIRKT
ncbi:MAG: helix-turn-helix domain-containing protein [Legionella sp.]|nr:helix-turn-helix domain-containing protein [Legionella sp.]